MLQEINLHHADTSHYASKLHKDLTMEANCFDRKAPDSEKLARRQGTTSKATGTASIINSQARYQIKHIDTENYPNISATESLNKEESLLTVGLYCPCTRNKEQDNLFDSFMNRAEAFITKQKEKSPDSHLIVCGDFNINEKSVSKQRRKRYEDFKNTFNLTEHKPKTVTFIPKGGKAGTSTLDWILTSDKIKVESIATVTLDDVTHPADHLPVKYTVTIPMKQKKDTKNNTNKKVDSNPNYINRKKINWELVDKTLYKLLARIFVKSIMEEIKDCSPQIQLKIISDQLSLCAQLSSRQPPKEKEQKKSKDMIHAERKLQLTNKKITKMALHLGIDRDISIPDLKDLIKENEGNDTMNKMKNLKYQVLDLRRELKLATNIWKDEQVRIINDEIDFILQEKSIEKIYTSFKSLQRRPNVGPPEEITYKNKTYTGEEVLRGFEVLTETRSQNMRPHDKEDDHYVNVTAIVDQLSQLYKNNSAHIKEMSQEKFSDVLASLPLRKAEDINNVTLENVIHTDDETLEILRNLTNKVVLNWEEYSSVTFNTVKAQMLYKAKGKPRDDPMSYRRISVGNVFQKISDRYMSEATQPIAKQAQGTSQYGFTKGTNFLLLTLLRENVQKYATEYKKMMICLATDISDAFSQTCRNSQLYECHVAGETEKIWKYTEATYRETHTVLTEGNRMGKLIQEHLGSRQGGIKSAPDFKLYYLMLDRMLKAADLGYKIDEMDEKLYLQLVADDSMSWIETPEQLQATIHLFEYYAKRYRMTFSFPKTLINVYGSKEQVDSVRNSTNIRIAGNHPTFPEEAAHLGLTQCQDITQTEIVNVKQRIKKATKKFYALFGHRFRSDTPLRIELSKMIWTVYIKPTLLTGLNALTVDKEALKLITDFEHTVLRSIFKVRKKAPVAHLYQISGLEPIEATLHKQVFGLFHNVWKNPDTPCTKLIKVILQSKDKFRLNYWPRHLQALAKRYKIPDPAILINRKHPEKDTWKKYVAQKIEQHHQDILRSKLQIMSTTTFLLDNTIYKYNKEGKRYLHTARNAKQLEAAHLKSLLLAGEYPTRTHEKRVRGKVTDNDNCTHCDLETPDTTIHMLEICQLTQTQEAIEARVKILEKYAAAKKTCPSSLQNYFLVNPGTLTTFLLNTQHKIIPPQLRVCSYSATSELLNTISVYIQVIHNLRKKKRHKTNENSLVHDGPESDKAPFEDNQRHEGSPSGKQNKITRYFNNSKSDEKNKGETNHNYNNRQVYNEMSLEAKRRSYLVNRPESQLLGIALNVKHLLVQGTLLPNMKVGYNQMEPEVIFRNSIHRDTTRPYPLVCGLELFATSRGILETLVAMTIETHEDHQYSQLKSKSKVILNHPHFLLCSEEEAHKYSKIPVTILCLERGASHEDQINPKPIYVTKFQPPVDFRDRKVDGYVAYFLSYGRQHDGFDKGALSYEEDFLRIKNGIYAGRTFPCERCEDWRCTNKGDPTACMLLFKWDTGDDEQARRCSIEITKTNPQIYNNMVDNLTRSHNIVSHASTIEYAKKIVEYDTAGKPFITLDEFHKDEKKLEETRELLRKPHLLSTPYRVDQRLNDLASTISSMRASLNTVEEHQVTDRNDLRIYLMGKQEQNKSASSGVSSGSSQLSGTKGNVKSRLGKREDESDTAQSEEEPPRPKTPRKKVPSPPMMSSTPQFPNSRYVGKRVTFDESPTLPAPKPSPVAPSPIPEKTKSRPATPMPATETSETVDLTKSSSSDSSTMQHSADSSDGAIQLKPTIEELKSKVLAINIDKLRRWENTLQKSQKDGVTMIPRNWKDVITKSRTIIENGADDDDHAIFKTHILDSPPTDLDESFFNFDSVTDFTIDHLPMSLNISDASDHPSIQALYGIAADELHMMGALDKAERPATDSMLEERNQHEINKEQGGAATVDEDILDYELEEVSQDESEVRPLHPDVHQMLQMLERVDAIRFKISAILKAKNLTIENGYIQINELLAEANEIFRNIRAAKKGYLEVKSLIDSADKFLHSTLDGFKYVRQAADPFLQVKQQVEVKLFKLTKRFIKSEEDLTKLGDIRDKVKNIFSTMINIHEQEKGWVEKLLNELKVATNVQHAIKCRLVTNGIPIPRCILRKESEVFDLDLEDLGEEEVVHVVPEPVTVSSEVSELGPTFETMDVPVVLIAQAEADTECDSSTSSEESYDSDEIPDLIPPPEAAPDESYDSDDIPDLIPPPETSPDQEIPTILIQDQELWQILKNKVALRTQKETSSQIADPWSDSIDLAPTAWERREMDDHLKEAEREEARKAQIADASSSREKEEVGEKEKEKTYTKAEIESLAKSSDTLDVVHHIAKHVYDHVKKRLPDHVKKDTGIMKVHLPLSCQNLDRFHATWCDIGLPHKHADTSDNCVSSHDEQGLNHYLSFQITILIISILYVTNLKVSIAGSGTPAEPNGTEEDIEETQGPHQEAPQVPQFCKKKKVSLESEHCKYFNTFHFTETQQHLQVLRMFALRLPQLSKPNARKEDKKGHIFPIEFEQDFQNIYVLYVSIVILSLNFIRMNRPQGHHVCEKSCPISNAQFYGKCSQNVKYILQKYLCYPLFSSMNKDNCYEGRQVFKTNKAQLLPAYFSHAKKIPPCAHPTDTRHDSYERKGKTSKNTKLFLKKKTRIVMTKKSFSRLEYRSGDLLSQEDIRTPHLYPCRPDRPDDTETRFSTVNSQQFGLDSRPDSRQGYTCTLSAHTNELFPRLENYHNETSQLYLFHQKNRLALRLKKSQFFSQKILTDRWKHEIIFLPLGHDEREQDTTRTGTFIYIIYNIYYLVTSYYLPLS